MSKKIAVILCGCGVYDGSEIHESVMTLLAIQKHGATPVNFAPNIDQAHVINHLNQTEMNETRNVLVESARIARGNIRDLAEFNADEVDALVIPGGFGAAKNLSDFAFKGDQCSVHPQVEAALKAIHAAGKPIGALCISPAVIAKVFGQVELTIGQDEGTAQALEKLGATHKKTSHGEVVIDQGKKIVTSPCYMLESTVPQIAEGAENVIKALLELM